MGVFLYNIGGGGFVSNIGVFLIIINRGFVSNVGVFVSNIGGVGYVSNVGVF